MPGDDKGAKQDSAPKQITSNEEFITKSALFVRIDVDGFEPPDAITFNCDTVGCGKGTTWYRVHDPEPLGKNIPGRRQVVDYDLMSAAYRCAKCNKPSLTVVYKNLKWGERPIKRGQYAIPPVDSLTPPQPSTEEVVVQVVKVGQYPEPSIELPRGLEESLGKDSAALYKKSLICRNNGYGLGAAAYMRRVVEDKTNELIEVVAQYAEAEGIDPKKVEEIRKLGNSDQYTHYEDKLKVASAVFPESLKLGGKNPLLSLYKLVSEAIHSKSEEECIQVASDTDFVFQYVFTNLKAEAGIKRAYLEKMKELP